VLRELPPISYGYVCFYAGASAITDRLQEDVAWLVKLLDACERALARLGGVDSPPRDLVESLEDLREQLLGRIARQREAASGEARQ